MIDIIKFTDFIVKLKITPNQFFLLYVTMVKNPTLMYKYLEALKEGNREMYDISNGIPEYEIDNLEERGLIVDMNSGNNKFFDHYMVSDKFARHFKVADTEEADEFWKTYPDSIIIDGRPVTTKGMGKDRFTAEYMRIIGHKKDLHDKIIKVLKYKKGKGLISTGIEKWLGERSWETFDDRLLEIESSII